MTRPIASGLTDSGTWTPPCPEGHRHTPCPDGYIAWHEWAEKMLETHEAEKCPACGLYQIWVPKK